MEILEKVFVPIFIFSYGFIFLHLGLAIILIRGKKKIHSISSVLSIIFASMCLFGSVTVYNGLSSVILNYIVFINLVLIAPIGLDFLIELFAVRDKWGKKLKAVQVITLLIIISGMILFYEEAKTNIIYSVAYAWLTA